ncbi:UNVERIFIED_CONTAM: hypothetical protein PYX00_001831 [Menopon gallinae]|uniref:Lipase maturation factor n=1 Tax=Menopon gallinae TaxID=328185 RepID=A0AAW2IDZ5_9NEOP
MAGFTYTRNLFLRMMCVIYLFAFLSFYIQIPGLFGNNGILPARNFLMDSSGKTLMENIHNKPTLLWFAPILRLNTEYMMDVLALIGVILSFSGFISQKFCSLPIFAALWSLYYSLYQVGQTFLWFQWDILLLEAGFLSILVAPFSNSSVRRLRKANVHDDVTFFLIKWLLFRLMFASGVVKLQSGCPTWWGLTALEVHFESQPLPTPLAWYAHHLPNWFLKLGVVYTHIVEQIVPFFFFFPIRYVRLTAFFCQVLLQVAIILTGNYNFFNLLTIVLCFSLLDDRCFFPHTVLSPFAEHRFLRMLATVAVYGFVSYIASVYYPMQFNSDWTVNSSIAFTRSEFDQFMKRAVPASFYVGGIALLWRSGQAINTCFRQKQLSTLLVTFGYIFVTWFMFGISMVPHSMLHKSSNSTVISDLRQIYAKIDHLQIANSYGLFRRMTGVGGRPEVVIEGANDIKGPWSEYHFKYKPTDVNSSLSFVFPYQPRLDWQMWFASLGTYHQNPWLMSLAYRILDGEKKVMQLMDVKRIPFNKPPKYLKASLYHYHYTPWSKRKSPTWWKREKSSEYFPIFAKDHAPLVDYLKSLKILDSKENIAKDEKKVLPWLKIALDALRDSIGRLDPFIFMWSVFSAGFAIISSRATIPKVSGNKKNLKE